MARRRAKHDRQQEDPMTKFEKIADQLRQAVASDDLDVKTAAIEMTRAEGFYDEFSDDEQYVLSRISGDVFSTRLELAMMNAKQAQGRAA
jgi:hypothetical protein